MYCSGDVVWSGSICLGAGYVNDIREGCYVFDICPIEIASSEEECENLSGNTITSAG